MAEEMVSKSATSASLYAEMSTTGGPWFDAIAAATSMPLFQSDTTLADALTRLDEFSVNFLTLIPSRTRINPIISRND